MRKRTAPGAMNMSELTTAISELTAAARQARPGSPRRRALECRRNRMLTQQQARASLLDSLAHAAIRQRQRNQASHDTA